MIETTDSTFVYCKFLFTLLGGYGENTMLVVSCWRDFWRMHLHHDSIFQSCNEW